MPDPRSIAYFSMEIGLHADIPTYAGGLGILAGDTLRSAADLHVPMVAMTLLHRAEVIIEGRTVHLRAWQYTIVRHQGV